MYEVVITDAAPWVGALAAIALLLVATALLAIANKRYNLTHSPTPVPAIAFALMCLIFYPCWAAWTWGPAMALAAVIGLTVLMGETPAADSPVRAFIAGSFIGWGAILSTAFVFLAGAFLGVLICLNYTRMRDLLGYLLGLLAPWWIMFGFGVLDPTRLEFPTVVTIFASPVHAQLGPVLLFGGMTLVTFIMMLRGLDRHINTNLRNRQRFLGFLTLWVFSLVMAVVDFSAFTAYPPVMFAGASIFFKTDA